MNKYIKLFRAFQSELEAAGTEYARLIRHNDPIDPAVISEIENAKRITINFELSQYFLASNGSMFANEEINTLESADYDQGYLTIHSWGNGDFDVIANDNNGIYRKGSVLFANHDVNVTAHVADNLVTWFTMLKNELLLRKCISHPRDYLVNAALSGGAYLSVVEQLRGTDCELFA